MSSSFTERTSIHFIFASGEHFACVQTSVPSSQFAENLPRNFCLSYVNHSWCCRTAEEGSQQSLRSFVQSICWDDNDVSTTIKRCNQVAIEQVRNYVLHARRCENEGLNCEDGDEAAGDDGKSFRESNRADNREESNGAVGSDDDEGSVDDDDRDDDDDKGDKESNGTMGSDDDEGSVDDDDRDDDDDKGDKESNGTMGSDDDEGSVDDEDGDDGNDDKGDGEASLKRSQELSKSFVCAFQKALSISVEDSADLPSLDTHNKDISTDGPGTSLSFRALLLSVEYQRTSLQLDFSVKKSRFLAFCFYMIAKHLTLGKHKTWRKKLWLELHSSSVEKSPERMYKYVYDISRLSGPSRALSIEKIVGALRQWNGPFARQPSFDVPRIVVGFSEDANTESICEAIGFVEQNSHASATNRGSPDLCGNSQDIHPEMSRKRASSSKKDSPAKRRCHRRKEQACHSQDKTGHTASTGNTNGQSTPLNAPEVCQVATEGLTSVEGYTSFPSNTENNTNVHRAPSDRFRIRPVSDLSTSTITGFNDPARQTSANHLGTSSTSSISADNSLYYNGPGGSGVLERHNDSISNQIQLAVSANDHGGLVENDTDVPSHAPRPIVDAHMAQYTVSPQDSVPRMQDIDVTNDIVRISPRPEEMTGLVSVTNAAGNISNFEDNSFTSFQPHDPNEEPPLASQSHSQNMPQGARLMTSHVPMIDTTRYSQSMDGQILQGSEVQQLMTSHVPMIDTTRYSQSMDGQILQGSEVQQLMTSHVPMIDTTRYSQSMDGQILQGSEVQQLMTSHVPMIDTTRYSQSMDGQILQGSEVQQLMTSHVPMIDTTRYSQSMELMDSRFYSPNIQHSIPQSTNTSIHPQFLQEADGSYNQFSSFHQPV
ncbi:hypothetical protein I7I51_01991 [Histoplasma capsulatum]|uniref:Uncharacterized protein n=1 Tax=Ajellomyces capsulatus TaxID=5037 RepID=A0A8A1MEJ0_AJECA|nr:predicted protein [Histoplasma mississippiense (nom. inval.)]EDN10530.1 predicted protein [Histoplasma mississippiense (nom. inval.)]QSS64916.1 hypothetical protein I7I51_01991 [Histoplasma capsulatum]